MHVVDLLEAVFSQEQGFGWMNLYEQDLVCRPSFGPQDSKETYILGLQKLEHCMMHTCV